MWRIDHNNNVGINAPEIEWSFEPDADWGEALVVRAMIEAGGSVEGRDGRSRRGLGEGSEGVGIEAVGTMES